MYFLRFFILFLCFLSWALMPSSARDRVNSEQRAHFERSMKLADGEDFRVKDVKPKVEPMISIIQIMSHMIGNIPKTIKSFDGTRNMIGIFNESLLDFLKKAGYNTMIDNKKIVWDPAGWSLFVGGLKQNFVSILENVKTACIAMKTPKKQSFSNKTKDFFQGGKNKKALAELEKKLNMSVTQMGAVLDELKAIQENNRQKNIESLEDWRVRVQDEDKILLGFFQKFSTHFDTFIKDFRVQK